VTTTTRIVACMAKGPFPPSNTDGVKYPEILASSLRFMQRLKRKNQSGKNEDDKVLSLYLHWLLLCMFTTVIVYVLMNLLNVNVDKRCAAVV